MSVFQQVHFWFSGLYPIRSFLWTSSKRFYFENLRSSLFCWKTSNLSSTSSPLIVRLSFAFKFNGKTLWRGHTCPTSITLNYGRAPHRASTSIRHMLNIFLFGLFRLRPLECEPFATHLSASWSNLLLLLSEGVESLSTSFLHGWNIKPSSSSSPRLWFH